MNILNLLWGFSTGGIGKLFLTYSELGRFDPDLNIVSVCIDLQNCRYDRNDLYNYRIQVINIRDRKDFSWINQLSRLANEVNPDLIFCHGFNGPIIVGITSIFCKKIRVPMVCTYHGLYNAPTTSRKILATIINKLQAWMYKKVAKKVVLVSKYSGEYLIRNGVSQDKLITIYNGIDGNLPTEKPVKLFFDGVKIGVVGRLDEIKGIRFLIEAVSQIREHIHFKFHVYIIGDGPAKDSLVELTKSLHVEELISFIGYQNNVSAWLDALDVFCLPSLQENHSIALLEAMRAGKAIVCTNVGGNPETVINGLHALLVPPKDSFSLSKALTNVVKSETLRINLGRNARARFYEKFTDLKMKEELCKVLKSTYNEN